MGSRSNPCSHCRTRKKRCDGVRPQCGRCQERGILECSYKKSQPLVQSRKHLSRGAACLPCTSKKKRCDATMPHCSTCAAAGKQADCVYKSKVPQYVPIFSPASTVSTGPAESLRRTSPTASHSSVVSGVSPESSAIPYAPASSTVVPILVKPNIDPLRLALSRVSLQDSNMVFRILFLMHRMQFGFHLRLSKQIAIYRGDFSHIEVHPFFIHFATFIGIYIYQERKGSFSLLHVQAMHLQYVMDSLANMQEELDPFTSAQATHCLALACIYTHIPYSWADYLRKAVEIVTRNNIGFVPPLPCHDSTKSDGSLVFTDEDAERIILLVQLLYSEVDHTLVHGHSEGWCSDLEKQFRAQVFVSYPILWEICPMTMRLRSLIFVKDARELMSTKEQNPSTWLPTCQTFIVALAAHVKHLGNRITYYEAEGDHDRCVSFRYSSIICLTTLAELYDTLARYHVSLTTQYRTKCSESLRRVVEQTRDQREDDFSFLDPLLGSCWARATSLFMSEEYFARPESAVVIDPNFELDSSISTKRLMPRVMYATLLNHQFKGETALPEERAMFGSADFASLVSVT